MNQTVIYEITAIVRAELVDAYEKYMRERHIPDLLATKYFSAAYFTRTLENRYRIQYHARDEDILREYLNKDAERLRADFNKHFPEGIEVSREVWIVLHSWLAEGSEK
jgi:hypothetical protein